MALDETNDVGRVGGLIHEFKADGQVHAIVQTNLPQRHCCARGERYRSNDGGS